MGSLKTMGAPMLASVGLLDHLAARNSWSASSLCGRIPRPPSRVARAIRSSDKPLRGFSLRSLGSLAARAPIALAIEESASSHRSNRPRGLSCLSRCRRRSWMLPCSNSSAYCFGRSRRASIAWSRVSIFLNRNSLLAAIGPIKDPRAEKPVFYKSMISRDQLLARLREKGDSRKTLLAIASDRFPSLSSGSLDKI